MLGQKLKDALSRLKEALNDLDPNDTESRAALQDLEKTIEAKLNTLPEGKEKELLQSKLEEKAIQFRGKHPLISNILDEITDILTNLGI